MESLAKFRYVLKPSNMTFNVFVKNSTISVPPLACKLVSPVLGSEAVKEEMSFMEHVTY